MKPETVYGYIYCINDSSIEKFIALNIFKQSPLITYKDECYFGRVRDNLGFD